VTVKTGVNTKIKKYYHTYLLKHSEWKSHRPIWTKTLFLMARLDSKCGGTVKILEIS